MIGRAFNRAQRQALWIFAEGRCEECGKELGEDFHADHVIPWSKKGATDVMNGRALCANCNLSKGAKSMTAKKDRFKWQPAALKVWDEKREYAPDFTLVGACGSGKSRWSARGARQMIQTGEIDRVIIVTPTADLKSSWKDDAAKEHLQLATEWFSDTVKGGRQFSLLKGMHGLVLTYQSVRDVNIQLLRALCARERVLVIFDEPHHLTEDEDIRQIWGPKAREAFDPSTFRLLITGTPWRTDGTAIPWAHYDDGVLRADFRYSYRDALRDGVVRPVTFHYQNSDNCRYALDDDEIIHTSLLDVPELEYGRTLKTLHHPHYDFVTKMLDRAINRLEQIRDKEHPDAAMLVVCRGAKAIPQIESLIANRIGSKQVAVAISADSGNEVIDKFRGSTQKVIIAIQMVAEGTNIPRLRVGAFLTSRRTDMALDQITGRTNRTTDAEDNKRFMAHWYFPELPIFTSFAKSYEDDRIAVLEEQSSEGNERGDRNGDDWSDRPFISLEASGIDGGCVLEGEIFSAEEIRGVERDLQGCSIDPEQLALWLRKKGHAIPTAEMVQEAAEPLENIAKQKRFRIRRKCNHLANKLFPDEPEKTRYKEMRKRLNKHFGITSIREDDLDPKFFDAAERWLDDQLIGREVV